MLLIQAPEIVRIDKIPGRLRSFESISKDIVALLPQLEDGMAIVLQFKDLEELKRGRKQILTAGIRFFGISGEVKTGSIDNNLYVWMLSKETTPNEEIKSEFKKLMGEK